MRLSTALASLGATLLLAAPSTAQSTTTTDVYDPTILSAAGNVTGLPGGNEFCGSERVRKPWGALSSDEQALYLEATKLAAANGGVADFAAIAADSLGQAQGEYSCAFFSWHRRLLLAYESYLRDLDERFACLTLPYYDVHTAYIQSVNGECTNMFECSGIFDAIGGAPNSTDETTLTFNGVNATGYAIAGAPYEDSCDDDKCSYVVRDDLSSKSVPSAASFSTFQSVVASSGDYATFLQGIQYGVHNEVLDAIGGTFSTAAAARDVLYYSWYSALDMYLHVYHLCRIGVPLTYAQIVESLEVYANATQTCGGVDGVDADSALIMRITIDGKLVDASQHPTLGQYFGYVGSDNWNYADIQQLGDYSYTYQLPEMLRQQILSNNDMCTGFNRAFAATYTTLNATAVKSTTTTKTTTKTTTTKTTKIVNGKKVTTTKVTKVVTKANSTSASTAKSTVTNGQLVSKYGYTYLGNFSTDNVAFGEGSLVSNGYTGYTAYYSNGAITTKHNGIVSANYSSSSSSSASTTSARMDATYSNTSNVVTNVTVGTSSVARNITASVATSGSYWAWLQTAYNGLYTRFEGNVDLVATHMKLLECYTFNSVYGLSNFTSTFVSDKNLVTNRVECSQHLDLVRSGLLQLAVRSTAYTAESLRFASSTVIKTIRTSYKRVTTRKVTYIRKSYIQKVQTNLDSTQQALDNITVTSTSDSGDDETSTTVVDTGYITSNLTSMTQESAVNASAVTTTSSSIMTTTTAANVSETLSEASTGTTDLDVSSTSQGSSGEVESITTASDAEAATSTTDQATTSSTADETSTTTASTSKGSTGSTNISGTSTTTTTNSGTPSTVSNTSTTADGSATTTAGQTTTAASGSATITAGQTTTTTGSNGDTITTTTGPNDETITTTTTTGGSTQTMITGSGGSVEATTTGSGATTTTVTAGSGDSTTATETSTGGSSSTEIETPAATPAVTTPDATPAATTPGATPAATTPSATPAPTKPIDTPSTTVPSATPSPTEPIDTPSTTVPSATPSATEPIDTPSTMVPSATPSATTTPSTTCIDVSVEGDATYCIEGPICSGSSDSPNGSLCPVKGDVAVQDCHETLTSYTNSGTCVAPENAWCAKIETGAWGCVFDSEKTATPAPTTTEEDTPTPAPTTETDMPTPAPTTSETEKPTPAPTTTTETEEPTPYPTTEATESRTTTSTKTDTTASSNDDEDYTIEQQTLAKSYAATTTVSDDSNTNTNGLATNAIVGIAGAVCAVVALAGFTAYKMKQRSSVGDVSPSGYHLQPTTPITRSIRL